MQKTGQGEAIVPCYVGKTKKPILERFKSHKRDAQKVKGDDKGGDGKLHAVMWGEGFNKFRCEEIDHAYDAQELSEKERIYQEKYQSIKYGWNKIVAQRIENENTGNISVKINNVERRFESVAHMCQTLGISNSTITYWLKKKNMTFEKALENAIKAKQESIDKSSQPVVIYRRPYRTLNDAVRDKKLNKHNLNEKSIRSRIRKSMSYEDAFSIPHKKGKTDNFTITTPDGKTHVFESIADAHRQLSANYKACAALTTVVAYINIKKYTPEQAFGFSPRPWEKVYAEVDNLITKDGYKLIGEKDGQSKPVILHAKKEIYSSVKVFAKEWGIEYTTAAEEIKKGFSAEKILSKRDHPGLLKTPTV